MVWCQAPLASGARKEREKKKKSISDNMRDRKLAAAQIRLPTFDKRKWANLVYPSKRLQSNTFLLWLSKTHERGRARARGEALQPRSGSVQEEGGCTGCSFYSGERLAVLFFRPAPLLTSPPPVVQGEHNYVSRTRRPRPGVGGLAEHHVNGKPLLLNISHLIWKVLNRAFN